MLENQERLTEALQEYQVAWNRLVEALNRYSSQGSKASSYIPEGAQQIADARLLEKEKRNAFEAALEACWPA